MHVTRAGERSDIHGLRAIAVLGVIAYHAAPKLFSGGFVGVDVFFIISGFLITTIILQQQDAGAFSLVDFYGRRIRRLFPALAVVLSTTLLLGWLYLLPHEFQALGKHALAGVTYASNFVLKGESGYFDAAADTKPLLHLWSLAIEWQFYLVWPLLLIVVRDRRALAIGMAVIVAASFTGSLVALARNPAAAFYLPQHRAWELALGALLALALLYRREAMTRILSGRLADVVSFGGLALVIGAGALLTDKNEYPGYWALLPTLGAVLIIAAGPQSASNRLLLSHPIAVFVGLISYSLYLWHWPLLSFAHILGADQDWRVVALLVAVTCPLAWVTYRTVEQPARKFRYRSLTATWLGGSTLAICVASLATHHDAIAPRLATPDMREISAATADWTFPNGLVRDKSEKALRDYSAGSAGATLLFLGDSHLQQYWPRIERVAQETRHLGRIRFATLGGCSPLLLPNANPNCAAFALRGAEIARSGEVKDVVIGGAWSGYLADTAAADAAASALQTLARELTSQGKRVFLILDTPAFEALSPTRGVHRSLFGSATLEPLLVPRTAFDAVWAYAGERMAAAARISGATIIDPTATLCDQSWCYGRTSTGEPIYMDSNHLRATFVREHATFMDVVLDNHPQAQATPDARALPISDRHSTITGTIRR